MKLEPVNSRWCNHGRRLWGNWKDGPPKFEVGDGSCLQYLVEKLYVIRNVHILPNTYRIVIANLKSDDIQHPSTHLFYCYCAFQAKLRPAIASLILNFHNEGTETKR